MIDPRCNPTGGYINKQPQFGTYVSVLNNTMVSSIKGFHCLSIPLVLFPDLPKEKASLGTRLGH